MQRRSFMEFREEWGWKLQVGEGFINKNVFIVNKKRKRGCLKEHAPKNHSYLLQEKC